jgi:hypothetical protein
MRWAFAVGLAAAVAAAAVAGLVERGRARAAGPSPAGTWGSAVGPPLEAREFAPEGAGPPLDFRPFPGRRILTGGPEGVWMYLDVWYIIGPFPLPPRGGAAPPNSLAFPPEAAVDLDAAYAGKGGMKLAWQWRMSNTLCVVPHVATNYAVWYAWTEVYSDADRDLWFAFGWDDYGKVWIGGELVADGGPTPHPWIPDRQFRKVHLKKGFTPVLVRLENAGGTTGFSVIAYLGQGGKPGGSAAPADAKEAKP